MSNFSFCLSQILLANSKAWSSLSHQTFKLNSNLYLFIIAPYLKYILIILLIFQIMSTLIFHFVNDNHSHLGRRKYHTTQEMSRVFFKKIKSPVGLGLSQKSFLV